MSYQNEWLNACFSKKAPKETITVSFRNGTQAIYSKSMLSLMIGDSMIIDIMDNQTGEMLWMCKN